MDNHNLNLGETCPDGQGQLSKFMLGMYVGAQFKFIFEPL